MRLLLVEDDTMLGGAVQKHLGHMGFAVDWVCTGKDFTEAVSVHRYDFVIMDLGLPDTCGEVLLHSLQHQQQRVPVVVVKCGKRGAFVQTEDRHWLVPTEPVIPVDTIGAGDSFNAGFLSAYLRGESLEVCAAFGNRTAALSTLRSGGTESFRDPSLVESLFVGER